MKKIESPQNNSGGLRKIYAIPDDAFNSVAPGVSNYSLLLNNTDNVICIECLPSGYGFYEERKESDSGDMYEIEISGFIFGNCSANDMIIDELRSGSWRILSVDNNNTLKLAGGNNVKLVFEYKTSSGTARQDKKGTSFSFKCTDQYPCMNIDANPF